MQQHPDLLSNHPDDLVKSAWRKLDSAAAPEGTLHVARRLAESAAVTLYEWGLPGETVAAALLVPLRNYALIDALALQQEFGSAAQLAERMLEFRSPLMAKTDPLGADSSAERHSSMLRRLFRQAYLDLPDFHLVLSILAEHEAHYQVMETPALAEETQNVFIPLTEMLGLWKLRRVWLERSAFLLAHTNPAAEKNYQYLKDLCADPAGYTREEIYNLAANRSEKQLPADRKRLLNKAQGYVHFEASLMERCRQYKFDDLPMVEPRVLEPGTILRRSSDRESQEEMAQRLGVRILCASEQDCYRLLGIVHSLGKPIAPKFSERFDDYIAAPQPNGYRALHTALSYKGFKKDAQN
ncbi:MAG: bifunctional (p)ppGpp synthetase/guanosine-3',5'-bis(diphosphate) 3'-pyrophosphohydrolase, partial [Anaerolineaceae bacterium]|nr:bifunctional (p)ppGpp synthetase/guanosine-3',5'-bis(diphosphate) 3'-pyrophosphohydrolase [Anaerolineaceae bacterium]